MWVIYICIADSIVYDCKIFLSRREKIHWKEMHLIKGRYEEEKINKSKMKMMSTISVKCNSLGDFICSLKFCWKNVRWMIKSWDDNDFVLFFLFFVNKDIYFHFVGCFFFDFLFRFLFIFFFHISCGNFLFRELMSS